MALDQGEAGQEEGQAGRQAGDVVAAPAFSLGDRIEVRVDKLVFGGLGLSHAEGRPVLVPYSAPGDRLVVRITRPGRRVCEGEIERIVERSPERREPACRHFGACGGCHLQHVSAAAQLAAKVEFVRDCLRRIGGIRWDGAIEIERAQEYGWRSRADLHVERESGRPPRIGYYRARSRDLVEVGECPILVPELRAELAKLASDRSRVPDGVERLSLAAGDDGSVAIGSGDGTLVRRRIEGVDYQFGEGSFSQANRALAPTLVRRAVGSRAGATAVDLYAGAGFFALQLAKSHAAVHAVEASAAAVRLLAQNARSNGVTNLRVAEMRVEDWLEKGETPRRPDLVLLDPPRAGAGHRVLEGIASIAPHAITYVSCDPATLARDLRALLEREFRIESLVALDLFPQSYHVEVVAHLARTP